jgi:ATP-binding cassette, subfamily F, member 3
MLRLLNVALARGTRVLYRHANLIASPGERIGLVGPNGCGKSTLFAAVLGELQPEEGDIETPPKERIAHVAQTFVTDNVPALEAVVAGHEPLMAAKKALAEAEKHGSEMALAQAQANLADINEGAVVARARTIMAGLGFSEKDGDKLVYDF